MHFPYKHVLRSALLAVAILGITVLPARAQLGVAGGLDFESLDDIETTTDDNATVENATGYHLGLVYDLGLGPLSLRPGVYYRMVGTYDFPNGKSDVTAWEVPVDARFTVLPVPLLKPYLLGGAQAVFMQGEDDEFDKELKDISYTFNVGVGASISVPGVNLTLQPELRYEFGASKYVDDEFQIGDDGPTFKPSDRRLSAFALRLHVLF